MSATALLAADLNSLITDSKRKNNELRQASESSLRLLKDIVNQTHTDKDALKGLSKSSVFINPFLIACSTRNVKYTATALQSLQRLVIGHAIPSCELNRVLGALDDAAHLGTELQLRVLQCLPAFTQSYNDDLVGDLLNNLLFLCSNLQASKVVVVINTASATLEQIIVSVFEKLSRETQQKSDQHVTQLDVEGQSLSLTQSQYDAQRIFSDLCLLTQGSQPKFLKTQSIPKTFGLELIESILTNHYKTFQSHLELASIIRLQLCPLIINLLRESLDFAICVRALRIIYILIQRLIPVLQTQCENVFDLLIALLDPNQAPNWKRVICMEVIQGVCSDYSLVLNILRDYDQRQGEMSIMDDLVTALLRVCSEQTSITSNLESIAEGSPQKQQQNPGMGLEDSASTTPQDTGSDQSKIIISLDSSVVKVPNIEKLDKTDAPTVPPSYIYYLVLISFCSLSDGLAQFIIPLCSETASSNNRKRGESDAKTNSPHSSPSKKRQGHKSNNYNNNDNSGNSSNRSSSPLPISKARGKHLSSVPISQGKAKLPPLVDPKFSAHNPFHTELVLSTSFLEKAWQQLLSGFTIFLQCGLDNDIFHMLLRSLQILAQVAGVLRVNTARDAFLGMLAKMAMPSVVLADQQVSTAPDGGMLKRLMSMDSIVGSLSGSSARHASSAEENVAPRSLLCLRALLNLGIALGPILGSSWTTILESLCYSEPLVSNALLHANKNKEIKLTHGYNIPNEAQAVKSSIKRLFDSTVSYPDDAFVEFIKCLLVFGQTRSGDPSESDGESKLPETPVSEASSYIQANEPATNVGFTLDKLSRVCEANTLRFLSGEPSRTGWNLASEYLVQIATSSMSQVGLRSEASEILHKLILSLASLYAARSDNTPPALNEKGDVIYLKALSLEFETIAQNEKQPSSSSQMRNVDCDIHVSALRTLYSLLDQYGIKRPEGWIEVFQMIVSCFDLREDLAHMGSKERMFIRAIVSSDKGPILVKEAFGCLSLINNDLIPNLPKSTLPCYINALHCFCLQQVDVNVSFTASSFTWTVSDYLQELESSSGEDLNEVVHSFSELKGLLDPSCSSYIPSLWLLVVCRIAEVCCDPRVEVRNGAIQVLYRIFCSHSASATHKNTWTSCFFLVMKTFMIIEPILDPKFGPQGTSTSQLKQDDTRTISLVMKTILQMFKEAFEEQNFDIASDDSWDLLIHFCAKEAALQVPEITASIFSFLSELMTLIIMKKVPLSSEELESIWNLWCKEGKDMPLSDDTCAIAALIEVIKCLPSIYVAFGRKFSLEQLGEALNILKRFLEWPYLSPYTSDIEKLSPLQQAVLESVRLIESDSHQETSLLLHFVCDIATLAFRQEGIPNVTSLPSNGLRTPYDQPSTPKKQSPKVYRPTYIALAFECFDTMGNIFSKSRLKSELLLDGSAAYLLSCLSLPIGKQLPIGMVIENPLQIADSLWRSATDKFINAVQEILIILSKVENSPNVKIDIWTEVIRGVCLILEGNPNKQEDEEVSGKDTDEEFDIKALMSLMEHIRPGISDPDVPDTLISNLLSSLLQSSQLYDSDAVIKDNNNMIEALEDLSTKVRFGRTDAITVTSRRRLSIKCLQELFDIALTEDQRQIRLSNAALGFVLWRSGLAIRDFTFDQPLRGLLPIPRIQRRELVLVLKGLNDLITAGKITTKNKHLYNLLLTSMMPASRDADILLLLEEIFKKM